MDSYYDLIGVVSWNIIFYKEANLYHIRATLLERWLCVGWSECLEVIRPGRSYCNSLNENNSDIKQE